MKKFNFFLESILDVFKYRWKIFLLVLIIQFVITILLNLGVKAPQIFNALLLPQATKKVHLDFPKITPAPLIRDVKDEIKERLEEKRNDFEIKRESSWMGSALAATNARYEGASSYLVIDYETGRVLTEKDAGKRLAIASLTKTMTSIVALDLAFSEDYFTASRKASLIPPTKIGVIPGEKLTLAELLHALMITSANDVAEVIKGGIDQKYNEEVFIWAMNEKAKTLKLKNSSFTNPQGFDNPQNYSSAEDLAILSRYALEHYPLIKEVVQKESYILPADKNHRRFDLFNWNGLVGVYPGAFGVKVGSTSNAQLTTVVTAERQGKKVMVVLLGAPTELTRDLWAAELLDLGFEKLGLEPIGVTETQLQQKYSTWRYWG